MSEEINRKFEEVQSRFEEVQSRISHNIETQFDSFKLMMQAFLDKIDENFESPTESSEIALGNDYCNSPMAEANATAEVIGVDKLLQPKEIDDYKGITSTNYETASTKIVEQKEACKVFAEMPDPFQEDKKDGRDESITEKAAKVEESSSLRWKENEDPIKPSAEQIEEVEDDSSGTTLHECESYGNVVGQFPLRRKRNLTAKDFSSVSLMRIEDYNSAVAVETSIEEAGKLLVVGVGQLYSSKMGILKVGCHMFDKMPKSFLVERNNWIESREKLALPTIGLPRIFGNEEVATEVSSANISPKSRLEEVSMYETIMFVFDPGGNHLFYKGRDTFEPKPFSVKHDTPHEDLGCHSFFKSNGDQQDFDFWVDMLNFGFDYAIGVVTIEAVGIDKAVGWSMCGCVWIVEQLEEFSGGKMIPPHIQLLHQLVYYFDLMVRLSSNMRKLSFHMLLWFVPSSILMDYCNMVDLDCPVVIIDPQGNGFRHDLILTRWVEAIQQENGKIVVSPMGISHMGCHFFKSNGYKHDFDFWLGKLNAELIDIWALGCLHIVKAVNATINAAEGLAWLLSSFNAQTPGFGSKFFREFEDAPNFCIVQAWID